MKGTLYPRTSTVGGCTAHNALITVYPHQSDFEYIATLTGDGSWSPEKMRRYFERMDNNHYLLPGTPGHGDKGWLSTQTAPMDLVLKDPQLLSMLLGGAFALGNQTNSVFNLGTLLARDANQDTKSRDTSPGYYQIPIVTDDSHHNGPREHDGSKKYPLDIRTSWFATKFTFDHSVNPARASGVEFFDGQYLFRASPRSKEAEKGTPGTASTSHEVIVAGAVYNSPQLLKLNGVGPKDELRKFEINVAPDLPGVGSNLQDHHETAVQGHVPPGLGRAERVHAGSQRRG
ncbi:glucose-methanol-choline (gmc) oxidoreductase [Penicillium alfredii]|uniref:Glucose-methanol-choline (Gmc) oxidoreductase n=1 Tax=Penicillium alfredii TaxID=1506179 RepID=A0A9W9F194_9EURO|nr:glucose-methanol-choline (gmc) oxidoreductase [Penicillium alfredii]KAJ5091737.1 glucose-methanol-choline (gmc) oxidoreductase [Penicillium alfredii]